MIQKYAFINAKVKARRSLRLSGEFLQTLERSRSLQEAMQLFRDSPYSSLTDIYNETGDLRLVEKELLQLEINLFQKIRPFLPEDVESFSLALFLKYEIDSLKFALRLWFAQSVRGQSISSQIGYFLPVSISHRIDFSALINASDEEEIISLLAATPYAGRAGQALRKSRIDNSLFLVEWSLDSLYYDQVLKQLPVLGREDRREALQVVEHLTDKQNLLTLLLFRSSSIFPEDNPGRFYLPGGSKLDKPGFLRALGMNEAELRDLLHGMFPRLSFRSVNQELPLLFQDMEEDLNLLSRRLAAGNPFSIGVILSWYLSGQDELRNIKRILNDKYYEGGL